MKILPEDTYHMDLYLSDRMLSPYLACLYTTLSLENSPIMVPKSGLHNILQGPTTIFSLYERVGLLITSCLVQTPLDVTHTWAMHAFLALKKAVGIQ